MSFPPKNTEIDISARPHGRVAHCCESKAKAKIYQYAKLSKATLSKAKLSRREAKS